MSDEHNFQAKGRGAGTSCPHNTDKLRGPIERTARLERERVEKFAAMLALSYGGKR